MLLVRIFLFTGVACDVHCENDEAQGTNIVPHTGLFRTKTTTRKEPRRPACVAWLLRRNGESILAKQ